MVPNPYVNAGRGDDPVDSMAGSQSAYASPDIFRDAPWTDEYGWAPSLRAGSESIPDSARLGQRPLRHHRPPASSAPGAWFSARNDVEERHSVEDQDTDGWAEQKGRKGFAPNPRSIPIPEPRLTSQLAPRSYSFTRPFDTGMARQLNGIHFSMADNMREYDILGMAPVRTARTTYRIDPTPWDADSGDMPVDVQPTVIPGRVQAIDVPPSPNRSWRL